MIGGPLSLHSRSSNRLSFRRGALRLSSQAEASARNPLLALEDCEDPRAVYARTKRAPRLVVRDPGNSPLRARRLTALWQLAAGAVSVAWWKRFTGRPEQSFVPEGIPPEPTGASSDRLEPLEEMLLKLLGPDDDERLPLPPRPPKVANSARVILKLRLDVSPPTFFQELVTDRLEKLSDRLSQPGNLTVLSVLGRSAFSLSGPAACARARVWEGEGSEAHSRATRLQMHVQVPATLVRLQTAQPGPPSEVATLDGALLCIARQSFRESFRSRARKPGADSAGGENPQERPEVVVSVHESRVRKDLNVLGYEAWSRRRHADICLLPRCGGLRSLRNSTQSPRKVWKLAELKTLCLSRRRKIHPTKWNGDGPSWGSGSQRSSPLETELRKKLRDNRFKHWSLDIERYASLSPKSGPSCTSTSSTLSSF